MKDIKKIYFDMDGVLADFNKGLIELCNITPVDQSQATPDDDNATFNAIRHADHFYRKLDMVEGAKDLFDTLYEKFGDKCEILTGVPNPKRNIPEASEDKRAWAKEKLSDKVVVHTVRRAQKKHYCKGPEYILIDDYQKNIDEWKKNGGTGILFRNVGQVLEEIEDYLDEEGKEQKVEETKKVRNIRPMSSIDVSEILDGWNGSFNRDISNPTDQWYLAAFPIMSGSQASQVALIFEQDIRVNEGQVGCICKYRILLYDMTVSPTIINSSEFEFKDWKVYTAWFFKSNLYVVMADSDAEFNVIKILGDGNESVLNLGKYVTDISTTSKGDILVGYDCCDDPTEKREAIILFSRNGENKSLETNDAISSEAVCVDSKDGLWAYVKPYNFICHMDGDRYENFQISLSGFSGIGVSDDGNILLASISFKYHGAKLYAFTKDDEDRFGDEIEVLIDSGETGQEGSVDAVAFEGNKAVVRRGNVLHMININELGWTKEECMKNENHKASNDNEK